MTTIIDDQRLFCRSDKVLVSEVEGEILMMEPEKGICYALNRTGAAVWEKLAVPTGLAELCDSLTGRFAIGQAECATEVARLLEALLEEDLVIASIA